MRSLDICQKCDNFIKASNGIICDFVYQLKWDQPTPFFESYVEAWEKHGKECYQCGQVIENKLEPVPIESFIQCDIPNDCHMKMEQIVINQVGIK